MSLRLVHGEKLLLMKRSLPMDAEVAEAVAAVVVLRSGSELTLAALKDWCDGKLSAYKIPKKLLLQDALPRNAMGKVTKPALKTRF